VNRKRTLGCKHEVQVAHGWHAWRATVTTDKVLGRLYSASGCGFNRSTQRIGQIVAPVFQSLASFVAVR